MRVTTQPSAAKNVRGTYHEPLPDEPLRRGHSGDRVIELQRALNAANVKPPLEEDGKLGRLTEEALEKLTGSKVLDAGALERLAELQPTATASTPAGVDDTFDASAVHHDAPAAGVIPDVDTSAPNDVAARAVEYARSQDGSIDPRKRGADGHYHGWDKLRDVFTETTGVAVSDKEVQQHNQPLGKSWCGIWAAHVLRQAGADVKWDLTKGKMTGDVTHTVAPLFKNPTSYKVERAAFEQSIRPGDVITLSGKNNHHAVVTKVNADGTVDTMDGNKPHVGPGHYKLKDVTSFYRAGASADASSTPAAVPTSPPARRAGPSRGLSLTTAGDQGGGGMSTRAKAEAAVKARAADMAKPSTTAEIAADPKAFIARTPQVDGDMKSKDDAIVCGTMATMYGMIAGRPESLRELATKLVDDKGNATAEGQRAFPNLVGNANARQALLNIRNDRIAPKDVQTVARAMIHDVGDTSQGATAAGLIALRGKIARLGVAVPRYELQQYGNPNGGMGHWRVGVQGAQFSPWPGKDGKAEVITDGSGIARGSADMPGWMLREKIYLDDKHAHHLMYSVVVEGQTIRTASDPPLISLHYDRDDTRWKRTGNDVSGFLKHPDTPASIRDRVHSAVGGATPESVSY